MTLKEQFKRETGKSLDGTFQGDNSHNVADYISWLEAKAGQHETIVSTKYYVAKQIDFDEAKISVGFDSEEEAESFRDTMKQGNLYKDSNLIILKEC